MMNALLIILATVIYSAIHSLLASLGCKKMARQKFGASADRWYQLAYNIFAGISFLPILGLMAFLDDLPLYKIPSPWLILAIAGQALGALIIIVGVWQTGAWKFIGLSQIFGKPRPTKNSDLIVTGIYKRVRHPLYFGGLLFLWLSPIMTVNLLTLVVMLSIYLIIGAKLEEKRLLIEFGDAYRTYRQEVPMIIPKIGPLP